MLEILIKSKYKNSHALFVSFNCRKSNFMKKNATFHNNFRIMIEIRPFLIGIA